MIMRSNLPALAVMATLAVTAPAAHAVTTRAAARPATRSAGLSFIEDDYTRALAEAKARRVPLFIESWAPW